MKPFVMGLIVVILLALMVTPAIAQEPVPPPPPGCRYISDCICQGRVDLWVIGGLSVTTLDGTAIGRVYNGAGLDIYGMSTGAYQVSYGDGLYWVSRLLVHLETPERCAAQGIS